MAVHNGLASYQCRRDRETKPGVNRALHDKSIGAAEARAVARMLAGGQGLRGGDPTEEGEATVQNCCLWCLGDGRRVRETLRHVIMHCPAYKHERRAGLGEVGAREGMEILRMERERWGWADLRRHREFVYGIIKSRRRMGLQESRGDG